MRYRNRKYFEKRVQRLANTLGATITLESMNPGDGRRYQLHIQGDDTVNGYYPRHGHVITLEFDMYLSGLIDAVEALKSAEDNKRRSTRILKISGRFELTVEATERVYRPDTQVRLLLKKTTGSEWVVFSFEEDKDAYVFQALCINPTLAFDKRISNEDLTIFINAAEDIV